ncbi:cell wall hydrolase [Roseobacter phage CRP-603]|nr:cell wall hydrolase [Roseobacter phage CRP-603]
MVDYTYKLNLDEPTELGSKFKSRSRGIGAQPEKEEPQVDGWADMFYGLLQGYFGDEDEAKKVLTTAPDQPSYDMDEALETLKGVNLPSRISEPVIEGAPEKPEMVEPEGVTVKTEMSKEEADYETGKKIREQILKNQGIMSKPDADGVQPTDGKVYSSPDEMSDLEILARTIEAEAGVEEYTGKVAVGAVIANRAASGKYGEGIKGVILKKGQFSPWNAWTGYAKGEQGRDMMSLVPSEDSYKAAMSILKGEYEDETGGATHYVNPDVSKPKWYDVMKGRKRGVVTIGDHVFGNADSNTTYDGKSWILKEEEE